MARRRSENGAAQSHWPLVNAITVAGFKSIAERQRIEIRPLTILAGANSSGKSSMMQPALLMKQTLESPYDPGPLRIDGPNVKLTEFDQLFWNTGIERGRSIKVGFEAPNEAHVTSDFERTKAGVEIAKQEISHSGTRYTVRSPMTARDTRVVRQELGNPRAELSVVRDRCFLSVIDSRSSPPSAASVAYGFHEFLLNLIHLPGLRPRSGERLFPKAGIIQAFPGTFDDYFATVLNHWKRTKSEELLRVGRDLETIGLTWKVDVEEISDTALTIRVGRLPHAETRGANDMVNMADVGFGVSQALPVVVAVWAAKPGDTVYIEQPELHLHPSAQVRMASVLAEAAKRGVRVIAETHSSLLLLGIQTLVANGDLKPDLVKLHWFQRDKRGATTVTSADLDSRGAFGDWPEDFDQVELESDTQYLQAAGYRSRQR
jgi:predicted ATPase